MKYKKLIILLFVFLLAGCGNTNDINQPDPSNPKEIKKYTITFDTNGSIDIDAQEIEENDIIYLPIPLREGYSFIGWKASDSDELLLDELVVTQDYNLLAVYEEAVVGLEFTLQETIDYDDYYVVTNYSGTDEVITIPKIYNGYEVREIGNQAFSKNNTIKEVSLPNTIKTIAKEAFIDAQNLETIILPNDLKFIGAKAFYGCDSLKIDYIKAEVIAEAAFQGCTSLIDLKVEAREIQSSSFFRCSSLQTVELIGKVETIGQEVFMWTQALKYIYVDSSLYDYYNDLLKDNHQYTYYDIVTID